MANCIDLGNDSMSEILPELTNKWFKGTEWEEGNMTIDPQNITEREFIPLPIGKELTNNE